MKTVLLVEDNLSHSKLATMFLERAGYAVLQAQDAESGLRLARQHQPQLILMDVQLPGMDGLSAVRALKADPATNAIPVIAVTSYLENYAEIDARAAGAAALIVKPYHYQEFLAAVAALV